MTIKLLTWVFAILISIPGVSFSQSYDYREDIGACNAYTSIFENSPLTDYSESLFRNGLSADATVSAYQKLLGYDNPFVSLINSYFALSMGDIAVAAYNIELAQYQFFEKHDLCSIPVFAEFSIALRVELYEQMDADIATNISRRLIVLQKREQSSALRHFDEYMCAVQRFDLTTEHVFEDCVNGN